MGIWFSIPGATQSSSPEKISAGTLTLAAAIIADGVVSAAAKLITVFIVALFSEAKSEAPPPIE